MALSTIEVDASVATVYNTLLNPFTYPYWLVRAKATLSVDADWPNSGAQFRHVVGMGPLRISDTTSMIDAVEPRYIELEVNVRPLGKGRARFVVEPLTGTRTIVTLEETPESTGLRALRPLVDTLTSLRNQASLRALRKFVEAIQ